VSSYSEASWLRRLWSLARPGDPTTPYVSNVNLVNDGSVRSSRERAPYGRVLGTTAAPAAGEFAGWELRADDNLGVAPLTMLHGLRAFATGGAVLIGMVQAPTAALIADRTAAAFRFSDADPDITLSVFTLSSAGGDLPATPFTLPPDIGVTAGWGAIVPWPKLPFAGHWRNGESLYVWAFAADITLTIDATIQGVRS
jgi:hypothetical protein